jgi:hypothetical protein
MSFSPPRRVRLCYYNQWAAELESARDYCAKVPSLDLRGKVANPRDASLMRKARLDCDWYAANTHCFAESSDPLRGFLPAWVVGTQHLIGLAAAPREPGEERWLITMGQQPQYLGQLAGKVFELLARSGVRILYYAFDEASRQMPCFDAIAPWLDVLIHDESPLAAQGAERLRKDAVRIHRSWVANLVAGEVDFLEQPEEKIYFLGSQLGLTPHRERQIRFLTERFGDRFVVSCDHSQSVGTRGELRRYKVGFCPEGRKFTTPAMSQAHTDRPFWCGCMGMVPVSEDSVAGGRLDSLAGAGLIIRYPHGNLAALAEACTRALAVNSAERRRIYEHFNRHETVGAVVLDAIRQAQR